GLQKCHRYDTLTTSAPVCQPCASNAKAMGFVARRVRKIWVVCRDSCDVPTSLHRRSIHMKARVALRVVPIALALWFCQATWVLAGTSGGLTGTVVAQGAPVAGAKVTATSTSETVTTATDAGGHFSFVSLIP